MANGRRNHKAESATPVPTIINSMTTEQEAVERGLANFIAVSRERDALKAKIDVLEIDLQAKDAEIKALRGVMEFSEEQAKLREMETRNRINSYQNERDIAVADLSKAEQKFEDFYKSMLGQLQAFRVQSAQASELIKKAIEQ